MEHSKVLLQGSLWGNQNNPSLSFYFVLHTIRDIMILKLKKTGLKDTPKSVGHLRIKSYRVGV